MEQIVIEYLKENPGSKPIEVARHLHNIDDSIEPKRKSGNSILYRLAKKNLVIKKANEDGTNPRWYSNQ